MNDDIIYNSLITVKNVEGAAANANIDLRPTEGEMWEVIEIRAYHDDPAGLTCHFEYQDNANSTLYTFPDHAALAASTYVSLRLDDDFRQRLTVTFNKFIRWKCTGIAAGKKGYINAIIRIIKGLPDDLGL